MTGKYQRKNRQNLIARRLRKHRRIAKPVRSVEVFWNRAMRIEDARGMKWFIDGQNNMRLGIGVGVR